jgi:HSP20 family molecular chaperone IbpA
MAMSRYPYNRRSNLPTGFGDWGDLFQTMMNPSFFSRSLSTGLAAPVDVCERENEFEIRVACAGCRPEDIDVTVEEDTVRIRGRFPDHEHMGMGAEQSGQMQGASSGETSSGQTQSHAAQSGQMASGHMSGQSATGQMGQSAGQQMGGQTGQTSGQSGQMSGQHMAGQSAGRPMTGQTGQSSGQQMTGQTRGRSGQMSQGAQEQCLIRELPTGRFERDITLPMPVNSRDAQATFENGLLTLILPKTRAAQGHRIQIGQAQGSRAQGESGQSQGGETRGTGAM